MTKDQLEFCINEVKTEIEELKFEFNLLYSEKKNPVRYRHLGCEIIALEQELKELEDLYNKGEFDDEELSKRL